MVMALISKISRYKHLPVMTLVIAGTMSCKTAATSEDTAELASVRYEDGWFVVPFNEAWSKEKNKAIAGAVDAVAAAMDQKFPGAGIPEGTERLKQNIELETLETNAFKVMQDNVSLIEQETGFIGESLIPSAFMMFVSGPFVEKIPQLRSFLSANSKSYITLVLVPEYVYRVSRRDRTIISKWRYKLGAGVIFMGGSETEKFINKVVTFGVGTIFGPFTQPSDLTGVIVGAGVSPANWILPGTRYKGKMPFGANFNAFGVFSSMTSIQPRNLVLTANFAAKPLAKTKFITFAGGAATASDLLSALFNDVKLESKETVTSLDAPDVVVPTGGTPTSN